MPPLRRVFCNINVFEKSVLQVYGLHEDFHVLLFCADVCMAVLGARFLADSSIDLHPEFMKI